MYEHLQGYELRELAINGKLILSEMTEEDFTAIIDFELSTGNPDTKVMDFCFKGLKAFPIYNLEIDKPDFSTFTRPKLVTNNAPRTINLKDPRFMFGGVRSVNNIVTATNIFEQKLDRELSGKYEEKITQNGKVFYIWNKSGAFNITYLENNMVGNIMQNLSLNDAKEYVSLVA